MSSISIIVPAYNVDEYISDAINSILSQTILPDEIIIINDGSTDNTKKALLEYEQHPIIKIIHTKNRGLGEARNLGLKESTSEYIYFFDSDDLLNINFIENVSQNIKAYNSPDLIFFSGQSFYDEKYSNEKNFFPEYDRGFSDYFDNSYDLMLSLMNRNSFFSSACLYISKRDLWLNKSLKFKPIVHEDEDIIFQIAAHSQSSLVLQDVFFNRRIRSGSIMTGHRSIRNLNGFLSALESMYEFKSKYPALFIRLKPLWKRRLAVLTFHTLNLMRVLKKPVYNPLLAKAIYESFSFDRALKLIKLIRNKAYKE